MEMDVFMALKTAGVADVEARKAADPIRAGIAGEVAAAQKEVATKADLRTLEAGIRQEMAGLRHEMAGMRAEFFQRLSEMQRSTLAVVCGGVSLITVLMTVFKFVA